MSERHSEALTELVGGGKAEAMSSSMACTMPGRLSGAQA